MELLLTIAVGLLLAYANGANDNFKGVATLLGSRTTSYRGALAWATVTTLAGSATAMVLAGGLLAAFSGKGLLPAEVIADPRFPLSVALSAGLTVLLATRLGFPVSTTHALIGGLVGAGLLASPAGLNADRLATGFMLPLLVSPVLAVAGTLVVYPPLSYLRRRLGVGQETCLCIDNKIVVVPSPGAAQVMNATSTPTITIADRSTCHIRYRGQVMGIGARPALDVLHFLSAGVVSFARGLNDTPKIAALLVVGQMIAPNTAIVAVAIAIGVGGILQSHRVAQTMSTRITTMNPGQGFVANVVTGALVVGASQMGMPVSTTHVSCGSLFGIGITTREARWRTIGQILLAWVITLPLAAALGALAISIL